MGTIDISGHPVEEKKVCLMYHPQSLHRADSYLLAMVQEVIPLEVLEAQ